MRVVVVTGIWPPDVGGPATHAPEVARFLHEHGDAVEVVTTADAAPAAQPYRVHWVSRRIPPPARHAASARAIARAARFADVVYSTGTFTRTAVGSRTVRTPYVLKLTSDPAFERARRKRLVAGDLDAFQHERGVDTAALRAARDFAVRGAAHVICPSAYLGELARSWGARSVTVLPNPAPRVEGLASRDELRARLGLEGPTLAFAGRLTIQKSLEVALDAIARLDGVALLIAGEGDRREALEAHARGLALGDRVRFLGAQGRQQVLELFRAADAALLSSSWENFPHALVEALAVGTPVVSTGVGGVREIVEDGVNGLLVRPDDADVLAAAIHRFFDDPALAGRLRAAAAPSVERFAPEATLERLRGLLEQAAR